MDSERREIREMLGDQDRELYNKMFNRNLWMLAGGLTVLAGILGSVIWVLLYQRGRSFSSGRGIMMLILVGVAAGGGLGATLAKKLTRSRFVPKWPKWSDYVQPGGDFSQSVSEATKTARN